MVEVLSRSRKRAAERRGEGGGAPPEGPLALEGGWHQCVAAHLRLAFLHTHEESCPKKKELWCGPNPANRFGFQEFQETVTVRPPVTLFFVITLIGRNPVKLGFILTLESQMKPCLHSHFWALVDQ